MMGMVEESCGEYGEVYIPCIDEHGPVGVVGGSLP